MNIMIIFYSIKYPFQENIVCSGNTTKISRNINAFKVPFKIYLF